MRKPVASSRKKTAREQCFRRKGESDGSITITEGQIVMSKLEMLTPQNSAIALIDYQPAMYQGVQSHDRLVTSNNVQILAKAAKLFKIPTVLTTVAKDSFSSGRSPLPVARQHASD